MNKLYLTLLLAISIITISCVEKNKGYTINGIVKNIPDSTMITLSINNKEVDSTLIIGEKFQFKGKVEKLTNAYLLIKNSLNYKSFWIENNELDFIAEEGNFRMSKIMGSEIQKTADLLNARVIPIKNTLDSLSKFLFDQSLKKSFQDSIFVLYNATRVKELDIHKNFIKEYPNSIVSSHTLNVYKATFGKESTSELYNLISKELKESDNGKTIKKFIELYKNPQIGEKYVDFEQSNQFGNKVNLSDIKGKYVLVEFWASWCAPCRGENPTLLKYYKKYKDQGFEIIGVSLDNDKDKWVSAIEKDSLLWENVSDLKGTENEAAYIYGVNGIPDNFLIDQNGIIVARELRGGNLKKKLEEIFE